LAARGLFVRLTVRLAARSLACLSAVRFFAAAMAAFLACAGRFSQDVYPNYGPNMRPTQTSGAG
jgi:hypothetical protein